MRLALLEGEVPVCDVCEDFVERFSHFDDLLRDEIIFVAECHGKRETIRVTKRALVGAENVTLGRAFSKVKQLPVQRRA